MAPSAAMRVDGTRCAEPRHQAAIHNSKLNVNSHLITAGSDLSSSRCTLIICDSTDLIPEDTPNAMDQHPQELVDRICQSLEIQDLRHTLLLSRRFQLASERLSGAFTRRVFTASTAKKFIDTYSSHRLLYLRQVEIRPVFPRLQQSPDNIACRESETEIRLRDEGFSRQIQFLLTTLKTVEDRAGKWAPGRIRLTMFTPTRQVDTDVCLHRRYTSWRVRLLSNLLLPELRSVCAFEVFHGAPVNEIDMVKRTLFKLDYRVLIDLASKFTNLEYLGCNVGGDEWTPPFEDEVAQHFMEEYAGPTRDTRNDFARALESAELPKTLRRIQLDFLNPLSEVGGLDQRRSMPNLIGTAPYDTFSSSIKLLTHNLRKLQLRAVVDESVFSNSSMASFANLESLDVMFHPVHPSGSWYFKGPDGEGDDTVGRELTMDDYPSLTAIGDEDDFHNRLEDEGDRRSTTEPAEFRIVPIDDKIVPIFSAFAKATSEMPRLKEAALWSHLMWAPGELELEYQPEDLVDAPEAGQFLGFGVQYLKPNEKVWSPRTGVDYSASRQIWWSVGKWRPNEELQELCQNIGRREHGGALIEYWSDPQYGECLVYTDRFTGMDILK